MTQKFVPSRCRAVSQSDPLGSLPDYPAATRHEVFGNCFSQQSSQLTVFVVKKMLTDRNAAYVYGNGPFFGAWTIWLADPCGGPGPFGPLPWDFCIG